MAERSWRSPFRAAEDRNLGLEETEEDMPYWRSPFEAAEDRNVTQLIRVIRVQFGGWRWPSGTAKDCNKYGTQYARAGTAPGGRPSGRPRIATVRWAGTASPAGSWRSLSGAAEDRSDFVNSVPDGIETLAGVLRGAEDRNVGSGKARRLYASWRSLFGATEDRNCWSSGRERRAGFLAVALWGDRGS
ncbi:hypothetical protein [Streptomyces lavenduligriseus]|uniref:Uncharacterized protein n=1 Tax=Streptomyces lavenduligriseus TaxID=67315 RepID=A0ABT0NTJ2_9ACTN|nr:hypothetical protein [Streptomyces lavenduligriseus]MCL3994764.1 hypothetical protein [Streptomyces lavenduligriseus]